MPESDLVFERTDSRAGLGEETFEQILVREYPGLLHLAVSILHDRGSAEDATQRALERAWRSRQQLRDADKALPWLRRIVVREAQRERSSRWKLPGAAHFPGVDFEPDPIGVDSSHRHVEVLQALRKLPPDQSAVVVLHHYLRYPVLEIADITGAPVETIRSRLRLGMQKLRRELHDE